MTDIGNSVSIRALGWSTPKMEAFFSLENHPLPWAKFHCHAHDGSVCLLNICYTYGLPLTINKNPSFVSIYLPYMGPLPCLVFGRFLFIRFLGPAGCFVWISGHSGSETFMDHTAINGHMFSENLNLQWITTTSPSPLGEDAQYSKGTPEGPEFWWTKHGAGSPESNLWWVVIWIS